MEKRQYIRPTVCTIVIGPLCDSEIVNASVYEGKISDDKKIDNIKVKGESDTSGMDIWDVDKWSDD